MTSSRRSLLVLIAAALPTAIGLPTAAQAQTAEPPAKIAGVSFERRLSLLGKDLRLNGVGVRAVAWFKGYAAALYLTNKAGTADQAVATPGPKRLVLRMLREVPSVEFVKAFRQGMARNSPEDSHPKMAARIDSFADAVAAIGTVREGDVVNLDFDPTRGTLFTLNGTQRGEAIAGEDFYAALLRAFVGDKPYDEKLKAGLLGGLGRS
jgi:hypothetical protein